MFVCACLGVAESSKRRPVGAQTVMSPRCLPISHMRRSSHSTPPWQDEIERKYTPTTSDDDLGHVDLVVKVYRPGHTYKPARDRFRELRMRAARWSSDACANSRRDGLCICARASGAAMRGECRRSRQQHRWLVLLARAARRSVPSLVGAQIITKFATYAHKNTHVHMCKNSS
jgi:hypothetical protein